MPGRSPKPVRARAAVQRQQRFRYGWSAFGGTRFASGVRVNEVYRVCVGSAAVLVGAVLIVKQARTSPEERGVSIAPVPLEGGAGVVFTTPLLTMKMFSPLPSDYPISSCSLPRKQLLPYEKWNDCCSPKGKPSQFCGKLGSRFFGFRCVKNTVPQVSP